MNTNDDKQPRPSFFPPNDPRGVPESTTEAANAVGDTGAAAATIASFSEAAVSRQIPPTDRTSSENASPKPAVSRQIPPTDSPQAAVSRQIPPREQDKSTQATDDSRNESPPEFTHYRRGTERLAYEISRGAPLYRAAERAGVSERTAQRRWADPAFRHKVLEMRCEMYWRTTGRLATIMTEAAETLKQALQSESESIRVAAARAIFRFGRELGGQAQENALLAETLERLEGQMQPGEKGDTEQ